MRIRPRLSSLIWIVPWVGSVAACSSSDTILALTVTSGPDIGAVDNLHITVTPTGQSAFTTNIKPPSLDGSILPSFFERITLPGLGGPATVTVEAQNAASATTASGETSTTLIKDGAVAASVKLMLGGLPPPDAGSDGIADGGAAADAPQDTGSASDAPAGDVATDSGG